MKYVLSVIPESTFQLAHCCTCVSTCQCVYVRASKREENDLNALFYSLGYKRTTLLFPWHWAFLKYLLLTKFSKIYYKYFNKNFQVQHHPRRLEVQLTENIFLTLKNRKLFLLSKSQKLLALYHLFLLLVSQIRNNLTYIRSHFQCLVTTQPPFVSLPNVWTRWSPDFAWSAGWRARLSERQTWPLWNSRSGQLSSLHSQLRSPSGANLAQKAAHISAWIDPPCSTGASAVTMRSSILLPQSCSMGQEIWLFNPLAAAHDCLASEAERCRQPKVSMISNRFLSDFPQNVLV